jgi:MYXO-CTERM domain-containing protein
VQAVTADGQVDAGYGDGGLSQAEALPVGWCYSAAADAAGRLVIGGATNAGSNGAAFLTRLLGNGAIDPSFDARHVAASMQDVTDLAVATDGRIVITGQDRAGLSGVLVSRLQADGQLDAVFGRGGTTRIALPTSWPDNFHVEDLQLLRDGSIVVGGGTWTHVGGQPFVARLAGDASGGGPGLLGAKIARVEAREAEGRAIVAVERIAGRSGAVSVGYSTFAFPASDSTATAGADFTPVQGRLTWADGDDSEREIVVPLIADASGAERPETFEVRLNDVQGGGLALDRTTVDIVGDAFPAGMFRIEARSVFRESEASVLVIVHREDYSKNDVSVLVSVTGGTAQAGSDYRFAAPVRLTWRDGETTPKTVNIGLVNDTSKEPQETIEVSLSDATGGALISPTRSVTVAIDDDDTVMGGSSGGGGGGGSAGGPLALLAAAAAWLRRRRP